VSGRADLLGLQAEHHQQVGQQLAELLRGGVDRAQEADALPLRQPLPAAEQQVDVVGDHEQGLLELVSEHGHEIALELAGVGEGEVGLVEFRGVPGEGELGLLPVGDVLEGAKEVADLPVLGRYRCDAC
jgi:hypothetical protein